MMANSKRKSHEMYAKLLDIIAIILNMNKNRENGDMATNHSISSSSAPRLQRQNAVTMTTKPLSPCTGDHHIAGKKNMFMFYVLSHFL